MNDLRFLGGASEVLGKWTPANNENAAAAHGRETRTLLAKLAERRRQLEQDHGLTMAELLLRMWPSPTTIEAAELISYLNEHPRDDARDELSRKVQAQLVDLQMLISKLDNDALDPTVGLLRAYAHALGMSTIVDAHLASGAS